MDEQTTINVKSVAVSAWNRAKMAARRDGASMGEWLTRAINQLADKEEAGPREIAPDNPSAKPVPMDQVATLLHAIAAVGASPGVPLTKANIGRANRLVEDTIQAVRGLPPRQRRLEKPAIPALANEIAEPAKEIRKMGNPGSDGPSDSQIPTPVKKIRKMGNL